MTESLQFMQALFGDTDQHFLLWTLPDKTSYWFTDPQDAESKVLELVESRQEVYVGCGLSPADMGPNRRCNASDISGIVGLWADVDVADPVHTKKNLPPDIESAVWLVNSMGLKPTFVVSSGHGLHAWWLFDEPWTFDTDEERTAACNLVVSWGRTLKGRANARGWTVDPVFDLARILRVPGTKNFKNVNEPKAVKILEQSDVRYNPTDFEDYVADYATNPRDPMVPISGLIYDAKAQADSDKFALMAENDDMFLPTWNHKRKDMDDQSLSSYDFALINLLVPAGWTNQEIVDLLIAHRRKYEGDLKLRDSYYAVSIAKVRADFDGLERKKPASVREIEEKAVEILTTPPEGKDEKRREILEMVSSKIGVQVIRFIKYKCDPPRYEIVTDRGSARFDGIDVFAAKAKFVNSLAQVLDYFVDIPNKEWLSIKNAIFACIEVEDLGEDATEKGEVRRWLSQYLDEAYFADHIWESSPWKDKDGTVYIHMPDFCGWLDRRHKVRLTTRDAGVRIKSIGGKPEKPSVRDENGKIRSPNVYSLRDVELYAN